MDAIPIGVYLSTSKHQKEKNVFGRRRLLSLAVAALATVGTASLAAPRKRRKSAGMTKFFPTRESLNSHTLPAWFDDAKFGIFIHWGLYSVPAFAPFGPNPNPSAPDMMRSNPYAEWYENTLKFPESETAAYHRKTYDDAPYSDFRKGFEAGAATFAAQEWADIFRESGARYVTLVTKHHDGYLLWPSKHKNPHRPDWQSKTDIVGQMAKATRAAGLRFGTYYSGGLDWTFNPARVDNGGAMIRSMPTDDAYDRYCLDHYFDLIERYKPDYLWNDIGYPTTASMLKLIAHFYNGNADGVVNDRWIGAREFLSGTAEEQAVRFKRLLSYFKQHRIAPPDHYDVITPEYSPDAKLLEKKWETTRGIGFSFGYNQRETDAQLMSAQAIIHLLINCVANGGNLLLNVGPRGDGTLCPMQVKRLRAVGAWLRVNGEAIYATKPWRIAQAETKDGRQVRFTAKGNSVYALVLDGLDAPLDLSGIEGLSGKVGTSLGTASEFARVWRYQG
jgi:alpha-L-fucosidase